MRGVGGGVDLLEESRGGIVHGAQAPFLLHHRTLGLKELGVEHEVLHPIGLQIHHDSEAIARQGRKVRGGVP